jgi:hypothetical protein
VEAIPQGSSQPLARVSSTNDGHFRIGLPPGTYLVRAAGSPPTGCHPVSVVVPRNGWANVTIICSRGIY